MPPLPSVGRHFRRTPGEDAVPGNSLGRDLAEQARLGRLTLLFQACEPESNNAVVLKGVIEQEQQEVEQPRVTSWLSGLD